MGEVQDIAQSTVFLFSEGASYITGVVLVVDGNYYINHSYNLSNNTCYRWRLVEPWIRW